MKKTTRLTAMKIMGIIIMLAAFPIVPDEYPWYYELILFNIGLFLWLASKQEKFRKEIGSFFGVKRSS